MTIPRLELTAATLAVKCASLVREEVDTTFKRVIFWTDSMLVINYIRNNKTRFSTFVANRLSIIHEGSECEQWRHVDTANNPADIASRGMHLSKKVEVEMWLKGPVFLKNKEDKWPKGNLGMALLSISDPDVKYAAAATVNSCDYIESLFGRFSSWSRLKVFVAWMLRVKGNLMQRCKTRTPPKGRVRRIEPITSSELDVAETEIIRYLQSETSKQPMGNDTSKLDPFKDEKGIIRVGGRIAGASIPLEAKHPILLPKTSIVAGIIINDIHQRMGHVGRNAILARFREKYWVTRALKLTKSIFSRCVTCRRYNGRLETQKMSELPKQRLMSGEKPFTRSGVDYFGPIEIKRGRTVLKRYGVVFTCFNTRAIHLEMADSLDTDSCINAVRRFIARRGAVRYMLSDNGTNLVGADKELRKGMKEWNNTQIHTVRQNGIDWRFNPPAASHQGGVWERMIRSIRKVLYGLLKEQTIKLNDEGLRTLFCEVEAIVNGRPLTMLSDDPKEDRPLTPNHLLLAQADYIPAPGIFSEADVYRKRWRQAQYLVNVFWARWRKEYLATLMERQKWFKERRNVDVGDIVIIAENSPRGQWPMARVLEAYKDARGLVRSVKLRTANAELVRPITKLVVILEAESQ
ncbi:uncharacterized protein [Antedon mediterranea]|uniref:uncharacterized protein n=1 Tax=Antedon mediterranea TaxID=105859 RepID=UPI003AF70C00